MLYQNNMIHDFMTRLWFYTYLFGGDVLYFFKCAGKILSRSLKPEIIFLILCFQNYGFSQKIFVVLIHCTFCGTYSVSWYCACNLYYPKSHTVSGKWCIIILYEYETTWSKFFHVAPIWIWVFFCSTVISWGHYESGLYVAV